MIKGSIVDIDFNPKIMALRGGGLLQRDVELTITVNMANEEFDKLTAALRNPTCFNVAIYQKDDPPPEP